MRIAESVLLTYIPTTDGRELLLNRYAQPERELQLLLERLKLELPAQPRPKSSAAQAASLTGVYCNLVRRTGDYSTGYAFVPPESAKSD